MADRPIIDQCPSCGRISLQWERPSGRWTCRAEGCGFSCEFDDLADRVQVRRELEGRACRDVHSNDLLRMTECGGMLADTDRLDWLDRQDGDTIDAVGWVYWKNPRAGWRAAVDKVREIDGRLAADDR